jgi:hypothetical protein
MSTCERCNTEITAEPVNKGEYGGDWHFSCPICEWYSEGETSTRSKIKQGLTLEELVEHKAKLNSVYEKLHRFQYMSINPAPTRTMSEEIMAELAEAMNQLLEKLNMKQRTVAYRFGEVIGFVIAHAIIIFWIKPKQIMDKLLSWSMAEREIQN